MIGNIRKLKIENIRKLKIFVIKVINFAQTENNIIM